LKKRQPILASWQRRTIARWKTFITFTNIFDDEEPSYASQSFRKIRQNLRCWKFTE